MSDNSIDPKKDNRSWPDLVGRRLLVKPFQVVNPQTFEVKLLEYDPSSSQMKLNFGSSGEGWRDPKNFEIVSVLHDEECMERAKRLADLMGGNGLTTNGSIERVAEQLEDWRALDRRE